MDNQIEKARRPRRVSQVDVQELVEALNIFSSNDGPLSCMLNDIQTRLRSLEDTSLVTGETVSRSTDQLKKLTDTMYGNGNGAQDGIKFQVKILLAKMDSIERLGWIIAGAGVGIFVTFVIKLILTHGTVLVP